MGLFGRRTGIALDWTGRTGGSARSRDGWPAAAATSKQAATAAAVTEGSAHYSHSRAQTAQPEDLGRDAGGNGAGVRGWWMDDGVQHKPTWLRRLPPIRVGWCGGSRDVCTRVPYLRANSIWCTAGDEPGRRQAGLTQACACLMGVRGRSNERVCERIVCMQQQHMRGRHGRRALPTVTST